MTLPLMIINIKVADNCYLVVFNPIKNVNYVNVNLLIQNY